ncbi:MAG TPA: hypothetical protein V6D11_31150 [Waterburya sp.]|jgi:hypothetical protein
MTYYELYNDITTLVSSKTEHIGIATTPSWPSLFLRLNTLSTDAWRYLRPATREAKKESVQRWSNSFLQSGCHYEGQVNRQILLLRDEELLRPEIWQRWVDAFLCCVLWDEHSQGVHALRYHSLCDSG